MTENPQGANQMTTAIDHNTVTLNGIEYIRADQEPRPNPDSPWRIVMLQRGNVMVGRYTRDGEWCTLDDAQVIRRWGTTKGLGQLVDGPLIATILDPTNGRVEFHVSAQIASIAVNAKGWA